MFRIWAQIRWFVVAPLHLGCYWMVATHPTQLHWCVAWQASYDYDDRGVNFPTTAQWRQSHAHEKDAKMYCCSMVSVHPSRNTACWKKILSRRRRVTVLREHRKKPTNRKDNQRAHKKGSRQVPISTHRDNIKKKKKKIP